VKVYWSDSETLPLHTQTLLKQVISAGLRLHHIAKTAKTFPPSEIRETPLRKQRTGNGERRFLTHRKKSNIELNISLVTPAEMQELNNQYRSKNTPTDVLSFSTNEGENLGDIIICLDIAKNQAEAYGHSLERELAFLTAHGFLHLLGYDHLNPEDEANMIQAQKEMLAYVGVNR